MKFKNISVLFGSFFLVHSTFANDTFTATETQSADDSHPQIVQFEMTPATAANTQYSLTVDSHSYTYATTDADSVQTIFSKLQSKVRNDGIECTENSGTLTCSKNGNAIIKCTKDSDSSDSDTKITCIGEHNNISFIDIDPSTV